MAGRPLTLARRVAQIEQEAFETHAKLFLIAPVQYLSNAAEPSDPLAKAWRTACDCAAYASLAAERLLMELQTKAGLDAAAEAKRREAERSDVRGPVATKVMRDGAILSAARARVRVAKSD